MTDPNSGSRNYAGGEWDRTGPRRCGLRSFCRLRWGLGFRVSKISKIGNFFCKILQIFGGLVLGCIKTKFCKKICVWQHFSSSTRFASFCTAAISKFSQKIGLKNQQFLWKQAPFGTASQSSAARVRGLVEMLRTCEVHSSKPPSNETLCGISILLLREIFSVLNDEEVHRWKLCLLYERCRLHVAMF